MQVLQYLNSSQLRFLFAVLISVGSLTTALCTDLADPFRGSFCVTSAAVQLGDLSQELDVDIASAKAEAIDFFGPRLAGDAADEPREHASNKFSARSTIYFHLLTGPLAPNVRAVGDIAAWTNSRVRRLGSAARAHGPRRFRRASQTTDEACSEGMAVDSEETKIAMAFARLDQDGSGFISARELDLGYAAAFGNQVNHADIKAMLLKIDTDGDGRVSYSEFKRIMEGLPLRTK